MTVQCGVVVAGSKSDVMDASHQGYLVQSTGYLDHCASTVDAGAYAYSPNSLYIYEQERSDMANSYDQCGYMSSPKIEDVECSDFGELSPGMESRSVSMWVGDNGQCTLDTSEEQFKFAQLCSGKDLGLMNLDEVFQVDSNEAKQGPTLAELNSQDSMGFLDDIEDLSKIKTDDSKLAQSVSQSANFFGANEPVISVDSKVSRTLLSPSVKSEVASARLSSLPTVVQEKARNNMTNYSLSQLLVYPGNGSRNHGNTTSQTEATPEATQPEDSLMEKWEEIKELLHSNTGENSRVKPENDADAVMAEEMEEDAESLCGDSDHSDDETMSDVGQSLLAGILHGGKQRRGDGNDVVPNPRKMYNIGMELKKLNKRITDMTPVSELPSNERPRSRREKNKLASRACRLKKKAQHEANKVKLFGLEREHDKLNAVLNGIKQAIEECVHRPQVNHEEKMSTKLHNLIQRHLTHMIAGHTTEFVNTVLDKVAAGDPHGGLRKN